MPLTLLIRPQELGPKGPPILARQLQPTQLQPAFWIDFSNAATLFTDTARTTPVSADGDLIRGVLDQGARGLHLSTTTPPVYRVRAVNGLSVSRWDGVAKQLVSGPAILPQPFTRFAVVSCFDAGFNRIAVASGGGNDALGPY
jgi:hypothetical protein